MIQQKLLCGLIILLMALISSCKYAEDSPEDKAEQIRKGKIKKFHSKFNVPDHIKDPDEHIPQYTIRQDDDFKYIDTRVSLKGSSSPLHYIELIILTDHNHKELQKKVFQVLMVGMVILLQENLLFLELVK